VATRRPSVPRDTSSAIECAARHGRGSRAAIRGRETAPNGSVGVARDGAVIWWPSLRCRASLQPVARSIVRRSSAGNERLAPRKAKLSRGAGVFRGASEHSLQSKRALPCHRDPLCDASEFQGLRASPLVSAQLSRKRRAVSVNRTVPSSGFCSGEPYIRIFVQSLVTDARVMPPRDLASVKKRVK